MVDILEQENTNKNLQYEIAAYNSQLAQSKQSQMKLNMPKSTNNAGTDNAPFQPNLADNIVSSFAMPSLTTKNTTPYDN